MAGLGSQFSLLGCGLLALLGLHLACGSNRVGVVSQRGALKPSGANGANAEYAPGGEDASSDKSPTVTINTCQPKLALAPLTCGNIEFPIPVRSGLHLVGDPRIDTISNGDKIRLDPGSNVVTYGFLREPGAELDERTKVNVRAVFAYLETVIPLRFQEAENPTTARIRIQHAVLASNVAGNAYYPSSGSLVTFNSSFENTGSNGLFNGPGSAGFHIVAHEIGHALGLTHPFAQDSKLPADLDNWAQTVMSYTRPGTPPYLYMPNDVLALRTLYGTPTDYKAPEVIKLTSLSAWAGDAATAPQTPVKRSLHFADAVPLLDMSALPKEGGGYQIDLRPGGRIAKNAEIFTAPRNYFEKGLVLAYDAAVRNIVVTSSDDIVYGNKEANVVSGYRKDADNGNDTLQNFDQADSLDLSQFTEKSVARAPSGEDLLLTLPNNRGSIKLVGEAKNIKLLFAMEEAPAAPAPAEPPKPGSAGPEAGPSQPAIESLAGAVVSVGAAGVSSALPGAYTITWPIHLSGAVSDEVIVNYKIDAHVSSGIDPLAGSVSFAVGKTLTDITLHLSDDLIARLSNGEPLPIKLTLSSSRPNLQLPAEAASFELKIKADEGNCR